jgi:HSP20 family molecular chaperone IbpA
MLTKYSSIFDYDLGRNVLASSYDNVSSGEDGELLLSLFVPGVKKESIKVSINTDDRIIEISTQNKVLKRTVSSNYDLNSAKAHLSDGVLTVSFPKAVKNVIELSID